MAARDRHDAAFADIEGDGGDVRGGIIPPLAVERRNRVERLGGEQIVERHHAVRQIAAEPAHVANGKYFRRHVQRELTMIEAADMAAGDQHLGADAPERGDGVGTPPQQRQRRDDHPRAQHAEHGENILDDIRQLHTDDGVGRQSHGAQPAGDRRDHAIGLGKAEPTRRCVGKAVPVGRIRERQRAGPLLCEAAEHRVDGEAVARVGRCRRG